MKNFNDISHKSSIKEIYKTLAKVAIPMAFQGVLLSLVQLVDNLFIGHLHSATSIASGVNAINNLSFIITTIVTGFMAGIGVYFAQAAGKGNDSMQKKLFISKIFYMIIWALILITLAMLFTKQLSKIWLPPTGEIKEAQNSAKDYGSYIFPSLFIDYIVLVFSSSFKEKKKVWLSTAIAICAIAVNSSLNYSLMFVMKMGVKGSAIATMIARFVELIIWLGYVMIKKPNFLPCFKDIIYIKPWSTIVMVFRKSFWWMSNTLLTSLAFTLQIMFMSRISLDAGGALNSAGAIAQLVYAFTGGYATALGIIMMHVMAKNPDIKIKLLAKKIEKISISFGLLMGLVLISLCWSVFYLYPKYNENTKFQSMIMLIAIGTTIWINLWSVVYSSILKGLGYAKSILMFDGLNAWLISLPLTILLVMTAKYQIDFGYIYWFVCQSSILKPLMLRRYFNKQDTNKILIS